MKALSVPACRSAFLVLPVQLDHVDLLVSPQRKFDHAVEPRRRNFPGLEAARLLATCDELLLCSVSDASRPIREDVCFVFLDIAAPFTSGFGDGPEWHHLIALGRLVINRLLCCFQSCKLHNIGFALEVAFGQSGE